MLPAPPHAAPDDNLGSPDNDDTFFVMDETPGPCLFAHDPNSPIGRVMAEGQAAGKEALRAALKQVAASAE